MNDWTCDWVPDPLPGRGLDAAVAEEVFAWERMTVPADIDSQNVGNELLVPPGGLTSSYTLPPKGPINISFLVPGYSLDGGRDYQLLIDHFKGNGAGVGFQVVNRFVRAWVVSPQFEVKGETIPHALCLAALNAVRRRG